MPNFKEVLSHARFSEEKMQKANLFETEHFFCDLYCLRPGQKQKAHTHEDADKIYFVLEGSGTIQIGAQKRTVHPNEICLAPAGAVHGVENNEHENLTLLVFMAPNPNVKK